MNKMLFNQNHKRLFIVNVYMHVKLVNEFIKTNMNLIFFGLLICVDFVSLYHARRCK